MALFDIKNSIKKDMMNNQINWLMDDDAYRRMTDEFLRKHPIRYMSEEKLGFILFGGMLMLTVFSAGFLEHHQENLLVERIFADFGILFFFFSPIIILMLMCYDPLANNPIARYRHEVLQRICDIPFILDYMSARALETSDGIMRNYQLTLREMNNDGDLRSTLDLADFQFSIDKLPRQNELTLMARKASVTEISRGEDDRPLVHVHIHDWIEVLTD